MAQRDQRRRRTPALLFKEMTGLLSAALENHDDFILTREPRPGDEPEPGAEPVIHVLVGNLITPCRLNGLRGRVMLYEDEGARIVTLAAGTTPTARRKK